MGKRKNKDEEEEHIKRKIKKLKKKLNKRKKDETMDPVSDDPPSPPQAQELILPVEDEEQPGPSQAYTEQQPKMDEETLPQEFLIALGNEGEEIKEVGEAIRGELALRWAKIMSDGLTKEAKDQLTKKYPVPQNFPQAVAPVMNPEILSSLSELTIKRDKRIIARQNTIGKIMSSLGKSLTSLLKGDINSKILVEQINDAAKLAAEIFHQDSSSRKFFALSGANQTVKEAVRNEKPDELLFGINCAEKIRAAKTIHKTGTEIKNTGLRPKTPPKPQQVPVRKQGNWRGLPQNQQYRGRGRLQQVPRKQYSQPHPYQRDPKRPSRGNYRR